MLKCLTAVFSESIQLSNLIPYIVDNIVPNSFRHVGIIAGFLTPNSVIFVTVFPRRQLVLVR